MSSKPSRASSDPKLAQQRRKRLARTERQAIEGVQAMAEYIAAAQASIDRIPQLRAARLARAEKERNKGCVRLDKGQRPQLPRSARTAAAASKQPQSERLGLCAD